MYPISIRIAIILLIFIYSSTSIIGQTTTRFNDGYLSVFKATSSSALSNAGTAIVIEEYLPTGASQSSPNYSVTLPSVSSGIGTNDIVVSGTATAAGQISRSENGRYILIPGYHNLIGDANTTFNTTSVVRTLNGSGTMGAGISGANYSSGNNNLRGATSDDGTNFWMTGNGLGITTTTNGTTITNVSSTSTNNRAGFIYNGQLFLTTGGGSQGIYSVGSGKPINSGNTSVRLFTPANTDVYGFSISPDGLTIYFVGATSGGGTAGLYRCTNNGTTWTTGTQIASITGYTGIAVDWSAYSFSTSGANGSKIFISNPTTIVSAPDNGTSTISTTTLRTITGNNAFRGLAFSPTKSTFSLGSASPTSNLVPNTSGIPLAQFKYTANEGNVNLKKLIITNIGSASIATSTGADIYNFKLIGDANNNGIADAGETNLSSGVVSGSSITFSSISLSSYVNQGSDLNLLIIADISTSATASNTVILKLLTTNTINSIAYSSNISNSGGSLITLGTGSNAPIANTLTIGSFLPVKLISFIVKETEDYFVLNWKTASEWNNDHFEIERSNDGINFHKIGSVLGNRNAVGTK